jgi:riboflavin kinase/FMN adenylyltransferase
LEVHLLDFGENIYGEQVVVTFKYKIRDEMKFSSIEELKAHIFQDIQSAREFFAQGSNCLRDI